jgi:hypothetical protein
MFAKKSDFWTPLIFSCLSPYPFSGGMRGAQPTTGVTSKLLGFLRMPNVSVVRRFNYTSSDFLILEAIVVTNEQWNSEIKRALNDGSLPPLPNLHIELVHFPSDDLGTADVLRSIKDKLKVYV